jgi:antitoxin HigA-1
MAKLGNVHPGEVLLEEFLVQMGLRQNAVARAIGVASRRINEIVLGQRAITGETALRLAKAFGTSEGFWLGLQGELRLGRSAQGDIKGSQEGGAPGHVVRWPG